ncbi:MAG: sigma 54-interacting transcriptional regulator [Deltaproteobacteria bacterium]|nr:sigma 54-interacting transcriptional regulator [Deltaproteobacteria bacterium]
MLDLFSILPRIAESSSTVMIEGASGTGKELFARAIHKALERNQWKKLVTAQELGIDKGTLRRKIKQFGIQPTVY